MTSPDTVMLLIVDYDAAIGEQDSVRFLCTPLTSRWTVADPRGGQWGDHLPLP